MKTTVSPGIVAAVAVLLAGCASGAWKIEESSGGPGVDLPLLPAHRSVERVTLRLRGHDLEFVAYRTCDPALGAVRAQLLLETGVSVLDVAVRGADDEGGAGGALDAIPGLARVAAQDLRRAWGSRSVFRPVAAPEAVADRPRTGLRVSSAGAASSAERLRDGSVVVLAPFDPTAPDRRLCVTLLDPELVAEARIEYADFGDDGVPREIRLVDLRDGHSLDVEVEDVTLAARAAQ